MNTVEPLVPRTERQFRTHERSEERALPMHRRVADQIDIRELIRKLWRQKYVIVATTVVITVLAALVIWNLTPRYTANAYVMIEPREAQIVDIEAVLSGMPADSENIESQIQVIRSRKLAAKTIEKLQLDRDPEFNTSLQPPSALSQLMNWRSYVAYLPDGVRDTLFGTATEESEVVLSEEEEAEQLEARLIDRFLGKLKVSPEGRSRVIRITFEAERARTAATVANTLADFYIVAQLDAKFEATRRANEWLSERIADLSRQVDESEQAVETFRASHGLTQGQGTILAEQEVSQLSTQLVGERARRAEAEARLRQVQSLVSSDGVSTASDVMNAPMIQNLRQQETEIERRMAELSQEFGERHPTMVNIRAELADIRGKLQIEINRIVQSLRNEVAVARAREATLDQALTERKRAMADIKSSEVQLRALEREAEANRTLLETFLSRSKETRSQENFQQADASILSPAAVPNSPSYPNKKMMLAVALVVAGGIGVILAFLIEQSTRASAAPSRSNRCWA